jgi:hypothetical protein
MLEDKPRDVTSETVKIYMGVLRQTDDALTLYGANLCVACKGERARVACYIVEGESLCTDHAGEKIDAKREAARSLWGIANRLAPFGLSMFFMYHFISIQSVCYVWHNNADMLAHVFTTGQAVGEIWAVGYLLLSMAWLIVGAIDSK